MSPFYCGQLDAYPQRLAELEATEKWQKMEQLRERAQILINGWKAYETIITTKLDVMSPTNHDDFLAHQHENVKVNTTELTRHMHELAAVQMELRMDAKCAAEDGNEEWLEELETKFDEHSKTLGHSSIWWKLNFTLTKKH